MKIVCALVAIFTLSAFAQNPSWTDVGETNIAKLLQLNEITKKMKGKQLTPSLVEKLAQETMSYYAPMVSCSSGKGSRFAIDLNNVPITECWKQVTKIFQNTRSIDYDMHRMAIDPRSGGNIILAYVPWEGVGVTDAGQDVPGTRISGVNNYLYGFNDDGLIVKFDMDFDSGIIEDMQEKIMSYENHNFHKRTGSWTNVGQQNVATLTHMFKIARDMLVQKQQTPAMDSKMTDALLSYYAPKISCSASKGSSIAVALSNVPARDCLMAKAGMFADMKTIDMGLKKVAIDPQSDGKTILATMPYKMVGVTHDGQDVPGSRVDGIQTFSFDFNDEGKIMNYDSEFDSGIVEGMMAKVDSYEKNNGMQIYMDNQPETKFTSQSLIMPAAFLVSGLFSGALIAELTRKYRRGPVLLEDYSPIS